MNAKNLLVLAMALTTSPCAMSASGSDKSRKAVFPLTEREKKIVRDAQKIFKQAEKLPPPSPNMQDKMNSAHGEVEKSTGENGKKK